MPSPFMNIAVARAAERLPMLRRLPLARLVILAEVAMLAKDHFERLTPPERRRLVILVKDAKGRRSNLSDRERRELEQLIAKVEPKLFASLAVEKFSPLPRKRRTT
jgi:hypothetical protein